MHRKWVLRIVAVTLLLGGVMRLFATRSVFEAFGIGAVWMETPYATYIYRVLGGFVILAGIVLMIMARAPEKYSDLLKGTAVGFAVIGLVMAASGVVVGLPYRYCLPDPVYCLLVALLLRHSGRP